MPKKSHKLTDIKKLLAKALTPEQFGEAVGRSVRTLQRYDKKGKLKARRTKSRKVYYLPIDIEKFYQIGLTNG